MTRSGNGFRMRTFTRDTSSTSKRLKNELSRSDQSRRRSSLRFLHSGLVLLSTFGLFPTFASAQNVNIKWDSRRAFGYLQKVCEIGPRVSGTTGMIKQRTMIIDHFRQSGCEIRAQAFDVPHPQTGAPVRMTNLVISFDSTAKERVVLACHYDTRPFPDRDRVRPRGPFIGANDGASGVALLMEMAHHMKTIRPRYGVDFVMFDGEELVYADFDKYFYGSEHFARWYRDNPPEYKYVCGVVVDMVADKNLNLFIEKNSWKMAPKVTQSIWATARNMRGELINRQYRLVDY